MIAYDLPCAMEEGPAYVRGSRLAGAASPCVATDGKPARWGFLMNLAGGCTAYLPGWDREKCRPAITTGEGWRCHLPLVLPDLATRFRRDLTEREVVVVHLRSGFAIGIPNSAESPKSLVFTPEGGGLGGDVEQWSRDAWALYLQREVIEGEDGTKQVLLRADDGQTLRTISGAILRAYAVTHEWLSEYRTESGAAFFQTADMSPLLMALWGLDPKASPGADGALPCMPPGLCRKCGLPLRS